MKTIPALRQDTHVKVKHPLEHCFHQMGGHSPNAALDALSQALQANQHSMRAEEWAQQALPGASLLPGYAIGTVAELHRAYSRDQEFRRYVSVVDDYN